MPSDAQRTRRALRRLVPVPSRHHEEEAHVPDATRGWRVTLHLRPVGVAADELLRRVGRRDAHVAAGRTRTGVAVSVAVPAADAAGAVATALEAIQVDPAAGRAAEVEAVAAVGPRRIDDPASLTGELDLVDLEQVADLLEVSEAALWDFVTSPRFPSPAAHLSSGPVWRRGDILALLGEPCAPGAVGDEGGWPRRP